MVPDLPDTLPEQMRALLPDDSTAVSADEAIAIAAIRANGNTRRAHATRNRFPLGMNPAGSRRPAWAWLAVIAVLAVVLVVGFRALPSPKPSGVPVVETEPTRDDDSRPDNHVAESRHFTDDVHSKWMDDAHHHFYRSGPGHRSHE